MDWLRWTTIGLAIVMGCGCGEAERAERGAVTPTAETSAVVAGDQSQVVRVRQGTNMALDLLPGGEELVLSIQGKLFRVPASGGRAQPIIADGYDAREPDVAPGGGALVFQGYRDGNWDLFRLDLTTATVSKLTDDPFDDREPQYSPDGRSIAFASDRGGSYGVWILDLASMQMKQVSDTPADAYSPSWSPTGTDLAYALVLGREEGALVRQTLDGQAVTLASEAGTLNGVSWSADGESIAYQVLRRAGDPVTELRMLEVDSGDVVTWSPEGSDVFPFRASWSGETVLYTANGEINRQVRGQSPEVVPFSASFELRRTPYERRPRDHDDAGTRPALGLVSPSISPNGERIAFTALGDLMLWEPASAKLEKLTDDKWAESSPVWSHDGTRLAYISDQGGSVALWLYDFNVGAASRVPAAIAGPSYPSFAPDGESVAVYTTVRGNPLAGQMAIVKLDDGSVVPLHQPRPPQPISWSTDSGNLVTTSLAPYSRRYREGVYQLVVANRDSGEAIEVVPTPHRNVLDLVLIPGEQAISYVQDGRMWRMQLDEEYQPAGSPVALTADVTDNPSWSATGRFVVYMSGKRMMRLDSRTGTEQDVTPPVRYARSQPDGSWTMRVGRLFDATGDDYLTDVDIVVEGNRIRDVRPAEVAVSPDIDASGYVVFPGLFEMHGHMGAESEPQGRTWLAYGITTVRDPGSNPYLAKARQESWDSGRRDGPRTHITGYLTDGNRVYYSMAEGVTSDEHLKRALARVRDLELDFIKTYVRLPDLWQKRVIEFAHSIGIPVSSHELYPAVANGSDHVEHIGGTSRRGYQPKVSALGHSYDDVVRLLADSGMGMTATAVLPGYAVVVSEQPDFFVNAQFDHFYGEAGRRSAQLISRMFGAGAAAIATANGGLLKALVEENALLVTGTDSPFVPYGAGLHAELRLYQRAGLSGAQILRSATIASARAAGVADDLGTLQVGKLADFVVVDGDPLRSIGDADNVVMTVKNGVAYALEDLLE